MNLFRRTAPPRIEPAPQPERNEMNKSTIAEYDQRLEALQQRFQRLHGEIEQLKMERAFELRRLAGESARNSPASPVQRSAWNDYGFNNQVPDELEELLQ
jgi:hypothetical protein